MGVIKGDTIPPACRATGLDLHLDSDGVKVLILGQRVSGRFGATYQVSLNSRVCFPSPQTLNHSLLLSFSVGG